MNVCCTCSMGYYRHAFSYTRQQTISRWDRQFKWLYSVYRLQKSQHWNHWMCVAQVQCCTSDVFYITMPYKSWQGFQITVQCWKIVKTTGWMCVAHAQYMTTDMHLYILYSDMLQGGTDITNDCTVLKDCNDHWMDVCCTCSIHDYWYAFVYFVQWHVTRLDRHYKWLYSVKRL